MIISQQVERLPVHYRYYSILLLSVIITSVTFVIDDFIFAKMERITKLLDKNVSQLR